MPADDRTVLMAALKKLLGAKDSMCQCDCPECLAGDWVDCSNADCADPKLRGHSGAGGDAGRAEGAAVELRM
jgi:hypothetical protein